MRPIALLFPALLATAALAQQNPSTMPRIATVDPRFQSYNVEMVEIIGGRFWKPYASEGTVAPRPSGGALPGGIDPALFEQRKPADLSDPRLRKMAAALGPAYIRVSGSWANSVYFHDAATPPPATPPEGFTGILTRDQWKGVVDFAHAVDAKLVTSFAASMGTRDASGTWTPVQAEKFLAYTKSIGGDIAAAEFINEPTFASIAGVPKGYDGPAYGRDWAVFQPFFRAHAPNAILLGPGSVGEGIDLMPANSPVRLLPSKDILAASSSIPVDAFSYHFYGSVSSRCTGGMMGAGTTPDAALTDTWLSRTGTVHAFYGKLRDEYAPGKPMWLTETGQTACGGDRWASTFLDSFRYLDQLGQLARLDVKVVMHNTLAASDYALIDEKTMTPRPNYWAAILWHKTMGTTVLDAGESPATMVHVYAQCMKDHPGGVTVLAMNLDRAAAHTINVPGKATRYTLSSADLMSQTVDLNGKPLTLASNGDVPNLKGVASPGGATALSPASITFLTLADAKNPACR